MYKSIKVKNQDKNKDIRRSEINYTIEYNVMQPTATQHSITLHSRTTHYNTTTKHVPNL